MKKVVLIVFIASLPWLIGGCSLFGKKTDETATTQATPSPNASPSPTPTQPFKQGTQPGGASSSNIDIAGLIPSTPPSQVPVKKGRTDPFALVPVKPTITVDPTKLPENTAPAGGAAAPKTSSTSKTSKSSPVATGSRGSQAKAPISKVPIAPPPPPEPTEAKGVFVSGVVALSTGPVAIIKTPDKNVERTVTPGTFLANGQVLVKAIYAYSDDPVVILEQYGIEVAKKVGEAPIQANAQDAPQQQQPTPADPEQS